MPPKPMRSSGGQIPFEKEISTLTSALAQKGTPGVIALSVIFLVVWILPVMICALIYLHLPDEETTFTFFYYSLSIILLVVACWFSYLHTKNILLSLIPTIKAEAEIALLPKAFGGKITTNSGRIAVESLPYDVATIRAKKVLEALVRRISSLLRREYKTIRANIFRTSDNKWLTLADDFYVNMKGSKNNEEMGIRILNGFFSCGTAYRYFLPVLSAADSEGHWDHSTYGEMKKFYSDEDIREAISETKKANPELKWILSVPVPYQVKPFKMACAALNVDGLIERPSQGEIISLLHDVSTAAALIGVINKTSDILRGNCQRVDADRTRPNTEGRLKVSYAIEPEDFDPSVCPEPSQEFKDLLAEINGLEFFKQLTTTDVAEYLREQLYA